MFFSDYETPWLEGILNNCIGNKITWHVSKPLWPFHVCMPQWYMKILSTIPFENVFHAWDYWDTCLQVRMVLDNRYDQIHRMEERNEISWNIFHIYCCACWNVKIKNKQDKYIITLKIILRNKMRILYIFIAHK